METIRATEQDLINALCLHVASKRELQPQAVEVELLWDEEYGFSAEITVAGRTQMLMEANLIEAIRFWLQTELGRNPYSASVQLQLDEEEGIIVLIQY